MNARIALFFALALTACSRESAEVTTQPGGGAAAAQSRPASGGNEAVAAVLQSPGEANVVLRFALEARPIVGTPVSLRLDFAAAEVVPAVHATAEAQGLLMDASATGFDLSLPAAGVPVSHSLTLTPQAAGLVEVTVRLRSAGTEGTETVYAIPVLVTALAASSSAPAK